MNAENAKRSLKGLTPMLTEYFDRYVLIGRVAGSPHEVIVFAPTDPASISEFVSGSIPEAIKYLGMVNQVKK